MADRERIWRFQTAEYWDERYQQRAQEQGERSFDWLCRWEDVRPLLEPHLRGAALALDIGCGNAHFAAAVAAAMRLAVIGIDYSPALFDACAEALAAPDPASGADLPACGDAAGAGAAAVAHGRASPTAVGAVADNSSGVAAPGGGRGTWLVMDARFLAFRPACFDVVLDKGCLDALLAGYDQVQVLKGWGRPVSEREEARAAAAEAQVGALLAAVARVLAAGGRYVVVSYEPPQGRSRLLASCPSLQLTHQDLEPSTHNYLYVLRRLP